MNLLKPFYTGVALVLVCLAVLTTYFLYAYAISNNTLERAVFYSFMLAIVATMFVVAVKKMFSVKPIG